MNRVFKWSLAVGALALSTMAIHRLQADPSDDFSFASFQYETLIQLPSPITEQQVIQVLQDRLDLFPRSQVPALARHLMRLCKTHHFDPALILSLINVESRFKIKAVSPVGAKGLMQLMPGTAQFMARRLKMPYKGDRALFDPFTNLTLGVNYLSFLKEKYRGRSSYFHIAAYNIGPARLDYLIGRSKGFKPTQTKYYFEKIRAGVPSLRFYTGPDAPAPKLSADKPTRTASQEQEKSAEKGTRVGA